MRKKRLLCNTVSSLIFQFSTIVCGFILPRLILQSYGSQVNGLVLSITQFLQIIAFLELGVGAVVQSAFYKPLAEQNNEDISKITASANKFFRRLAEILVFYIIVLLVIYPSLVNKSFDYLYTIALILAMSISFFAQYYFGMVERLLLTADQKGYIQYTAQTVTLIINTIACGILIYAGCSIHIVKLATSIIYLIRPVILRIYVNRHYQIDRKLTYSEEPIKQKWNGVAQHVAAVVLDSTDTVVLTLFATLADVSIYSVYHLVIYGLKQLLTSMTTGIQALFGELWAKKEFDKLRNTFDWFEWIIHTVAVFLFGCTAILVVPFIRVYTSGINDANYVQPLFAALITLGYAWYCLQLPYCNMILAVGHYKQTQSIYIIAAAVNIVVSVITVTRLGLIGVALGTMVAMTFQMLWMAHYNYFHLLQRPMRTFAKQLMIDVFTVVTGCIVTGFIKLRAVNYLSWIIMAIIVAGIWAVIVAIMNILFYKDKMLILYRKLLRKNRYKKT